MTIIDCGAESGVGVEEFDRCMVRFTFLNLVTLLYCKDDRQISGHNGKTSLLNDFDAATHVPLTLPPTDHDQPFLQT